MRGSNDYSRVGDWPGEWLVAQTAPKDLQHTVEWIEDTGVSCYVPRVRVMWSQGRTSTRPLFPGGYIFAAVPHPGLLPDTLRDWQVSKIIHVADQQKFRCEIQAIQIGIELDPYAQLHSIMRQGREVEVIRGPFRGKRCKVVRIGNRDKLLLDMTIFGRAVAVELGAAQVEPVN